MHFSKKTGASGALISAGVALIGMAVKLANAGNYKFAAALGAIGVACVYAGIILNKQDILDQLEG